MKRSDETRSTGSLVKIPVASGEAYTPEAFAQLKRFHPTRRYECEYLGDGYVRVFEIKKER